MCKSWYVVVDGHWIVNCYKTLRIQLLDSRQVLLIQEFIIALRIGDVS